MHGQQPPRCRSLETLLMRQIDAEFFQLFGIVSPVKKVVLFPAFGNLALLAADFRPGGAIDPLFHLQEVSISLTTTSRTSFESLRTRTSRDFRRPVTILCESSFTLSRDNFI